DLGRIDQRGGTPLHDASQCGHVRVVKCLLDFKADPNMKGRSTSLFMFALSYMYTVDNDGETPLHLACFDGHLEVAEYLLDHNADP
ncbi:ankyrin, partial [Coprinellus micaceus]